MIKVMFIEGCCFHQKEEGFAHHFGFQLYSVYWVKFASHHSHVSVLLSLWDFSLKRACAFPLTCAP